jgi:hypothetical protein
MDKNKFIAVVLSIGVGLFVASPRLNSASSMEAVGFALQSLTQSASLKIALSMEK